MSDTKLAKSSAAALRINKGFYNSTPGSISNLIQKIDKLDFRDHDTYEQVVTDSRYYFRLEPIANTVISKMVDLAINDLVIPESSANVTEQSIFYAVKQDLLKFLRKAALEYLLTGLVVPQIKLTRLNKAQLREKRIKRLTSLLYPTEMWVRDGASVEISTPLLSVGESYFLIIPEEAIQFILSGGVYPDGNEDVDLYNRIVTLYPEFVQAIKRGETKILLNNPLIIKSTTLADSQYPIPYTHSALESMKHKRNVRKVDYSLAARIISGILHVRAGNDDFPLTEDQQYVLDDLEQKFKWRENLSVDDVERIFTLFTNHTIEMEWVFPDVSALLDDKKYDPINEDILVAFGFPRILITGETQKSFTSDPNIATLAPIQTLETMRDDLLVIVNAVFLQMAEQNPAISTVPEIYWRPISLISIQLFLEGIIKLYETGNLSRDSFSKAFGYDFANELKKRTEEDKAIKEAGVQEFAPVPHSNAPGSTTRGNNGQ